MRNSEAMAMVRQDPVHRAAEQMRNAEAMAIVRQDPVRREQETDRRRLVRQDPVRREQETDRRRLVWQDPVCREQETDQRRLVRQDPVRREQETDQRRLVWQDPVRREQETDRRRLVRQDPVRREQEVHRRRLVRQDPVRRAQEQSANTVRRRVVREQRPIHHEMATKFDRTSSSYLFNQPWGIWNVKCRQGCGYIHLSSSTPSTRRKCCANGLLSEASLNFIRMPCWGLPLTNYRLLWGMLYIVINLTNKARNITIYLQWLLPRYAITLDVADLQI